MSAFEKKLKYNLNIKMENKHIHILDEKKLQNKPNKHLQKFDLKY